MSRPTGPTMRALSAAVSIGALALGLSACGGSPGPEQTVTDFHQALKDKDFQVFCDTLAPDLIKPIEKAADGAKCADVMERNGDGLFGEVDQDAEIDIVDTTLSQDDTRATVTFTVGDHPQEELSLVKVDDEWKIGSLDEPTQAEDS